MLEFEAKRRELRQKELEAGQAQVGDIREGTGSVAEPIGELESNLTPKPRFDRKANHRRYMREWRRRWGALRKS
jgi:hypothetical protein